MPTSRTSGLSEPTGDDEISVGTLAYFRSRFKRRLYDRILEAFENSGITQTTLAKRLGLGTDRVCRVLGGPGNLTLDTVSDFMFASGGSEFDLSISYPLKKITAVSSIEASKQVQVNQPSSAHSGWMFAIYDTGLNSVNANNQSLLTGATTQPALRWFDVPRQTRPEEGVDAQLKELARPKELVA